MGVPDAQCLKHHAARSPAAHHRTPRDLSRRDAAPRAFDHEQRDAPPVMMAALVTDLRVKKTLARSMIEGCLRRCQMRAQIPSRSHFTRHRSCRAQAPAAPAHLLPWIDAISAKLGGSDKRGGNCPSGQGFVRRPAFSCVYAGGRVSRKSRSIDQGKCDS